VQLLRQAERASYLARPVEDLDGKFVSSQLHVDEVPYHLVPNAERCGAWAGDYRTRCDRAVHVPDDADVSSSAGGRHVALKDGRVVAWFGHRIPADYGRRGSPNHCL
jgi:hypothetical protein